VTIERVAHPEWCVPALLLLLGAAVALGVARFLARGRRRRLGSAAPAGLPLASDVALLVALACVVTALLGPRLGEKVVRVPASGVDLVLLLDVSRSMDARDVPPSRLARAQRAAEELLARLAPGDRAALAAFAGRGVLLTPLTPDRAALVELLGALDSGLLEPPSSNLGEGVRAALAAFEAGSERPRVLFVLSDGEDPEQRTETGAADALRADVRVLAAALGTESGAAVPSRGAPLRDESGALVISRRRAERLARLAAASGGEAYRGDAWGAFDFDAAAAAIRRDAGASRGQLVERRVRAVQVLPLAALAFLLLAAEGGLPLLLRQRRALSAALVASCALLAGASGVERGDALSDIETRVREQPGDARLLIALGLARLERGRHPSAQRALLAAALFAREPSLAALAYYDLGVAALEQGDLEAARNAFFDALALDPSDRQARFNLEWTLMALVKRAPLPVPELREPSQEDEKRQPRAEQLEPEHSPADEAAAAPAPDEEQRRRWLERVRDDPTHALRAAARAQRRASPRRGALAW
jgi:Ca-activated chloride channel family protein